MSPSHTILTRAQAARIRNLTRDKRARQKDGAFIVEGAKPVRDLLLTHPSEIQMLMMTSGFLRRESEQDRLVRESAGIPSYGCLDRNFAALSDLEAPQGVLAVVRKPRWNEQEVLERPTLLGLYGEGLQDPANVGAIIRTAAALNADALWLTPESADVYNPKVVRATSGALLTFPIFVLQDVAQLVRQGCALFSAEAGGRGTRALDTIRAVPQKLIIALGNESRGLSVATIRQAACRFTIPLDRQVESLNVAATAAIALYYLRNLPKKSPSAISPLS